MSTAALLVDLAPSNSAADNSGNMADSTRKAIVTDEHREEAARLLAIWKISPRETQGAFGVKWGIGGQGAVSNFLTGRSALSMKAAQGFADGLGCSIGDFSPRLAAEAEKFAASLQKRAPEYTPDAEATAKRLRGTGPADQIDLALAEVARAAAELDEIDLSSLKHLFSLLGNDSAKNVHIAQRMANLLGGSAAEHKPSEDRKKKGERPDITFVPSSNNNEQRGSTEEEKERRRGAGGVPGGDVGKR